MRINGNLNQAEFNSALKVCGSTPHANSAMDSLQAAVEEQPHVAVLRSLTSVAVAAAADECSPFVPVTTLLQSVFPRVRGAVSEEACLLVAISVLQLCDDGKCGTRAQRCLRR
ncbi:MAG: hypothetical protein EOO65_00220 [Methanosarcinales archaeon]|nr:MAG: hypothetical protein EOO65_00220 [Methanosarcinales archaeon]